MFCKPTDVPVEPELTVGGQSRSAGSQGRFPEGSMDDFTDGSPRAAGAPEQQPEWLNNLIADLLSEPKAEIRKLKQRIDELVKPMESGRVDLLKVRQRVEKMDKRLRDEVEARSMASLIQKVGGAPEETALVQEEVTARPRRPQRSSTKTPEKPEEKAKLTAGPALGAAQQAPLAAQLTAGDALADASVSREVATLQAEIHGLRGLVQEDMWASMEQQKRLQEIVSTHKFMNEEMAKLHKRCLALEVYGLRGDEATVVSNEPTATEMGARSLRLEVEEFKASVQADLQKRIEDLQAVCEAEFTGINKTLREMQETADDREFFSQDQVELLLKSQKLGSMKACLFSIYLLNHKGRAHKALEELTEKRREIERELLAFDSRRIAMLLHNEVDSFLERKKPPAVEEEDGKPESLFGAFFDKAEEGNVDAPEAPEKARKPWAFIKSLTADLK